MSCKKKRSFGPGSGSGRLSFMDKFQRGCEERSNAKAKSLARQRIDSDDEVELTSVVQQDSALNPNVVDGKQKFGFEIGDILHITYICDDPPKGCEWMKGADGNGGKFVAKVLK